MGEAWDLLRVLGEKDMDEPKRHEVIYCLAIIEIGKGKSFMHLNGGNNAEK